MLRRGSAAAILTNIAIHRSASITSPLALSHDNPRLYRRAATVARISIGRYVTATTTTGANPPPSSSAHLKGDIEEEDDRWHAAYLQSLMNKAGELSVRGLYSPGSRQPSGANANFFS